MNARLRPKAVRVVTVVLAVAVLATPGLASAIAVTLDEADQTRPRRVTASRAAPDAVMIVSFPVGSVDDGIQSGLTRLSQHMLLDGNAGEAAGALRRDLYAAAAEIEITTEVRRSTFRLRAPRASFDALAGRLLQLLFQPKLDKRQLARCKQLTLNDELPPGGRAHMLSFLAGSVIMTEGGGASGADFTNEPYGDDEVIPTLRFDDVERHVTEKLTPANATIILAGRFDASRMERAIRTYQGGSRRAPQRPDVKPYLPLRFEGRAPNEVYVQAHVVTLDSAEKAAAARLLAAILEERMQARLRKQGVSYALDAYVVRREWLDLLIIEVPVAPGVGVALETELRSMLGGVRDGTFLPGEFDRNKRFALAEMQRDDGDPARLADALLDSAGRISWHADEVRASLDSMAQAVFLAHARAWLDDKNTIRVTFAAGGGEPGKKP